MKYLKYFLKSETTEGYRWYLLCTTTPTIEIQEITELELHSYYSLETREIHADRPFIDRYRYKL